MMTNIKYSNCRQTTVCKDNRQRETTPAYDIWTTADCFSQWVSAQDVTQLLGDFLFLDEVTSWTRKPSASVYRCCSSFPMILP